MKVLAGFITRISRIMDSIAGWGIFSVMALVIINILMRTILNNPIQGIYEYVSFLTAVIIGLSLSWCGMEKAHIAIELVVEKLPAKIQKVIGFITKTVLSVFLFITGYYMLVHGLKVIKSGEVAVTSQIPFYPFIFIVGFGILVLGFVEMTKAVKGVFDK